MPVAAHELPKEKRSLFSQSTPSWSDSNGAEAATVELHATSNVFRVMLVNGKMNDAPAAGRENEASAIRSIVSQDRCHSGRVAGPEPSERQAKGYRSDRVSEGCLWSVSLSRDLTGADLTVDLPRGLMSAGVIVVSPMAITPFWTIQHECRDPHPAPPDELACLQAALHRTLSQCRAAHPTEPRTFVQPPRCQRLPVGSVQKALISSPPALDGIPPFRVWFDCGTTV